MVLISQQLLIYEEVLGESATSAFKVVFIFTVVQSWCLGG